jgi:hypothetical protein
LKAEFEAAGQKVELDFSDLEQRILKNLTEDNRKVMEKYFSQRDKQQEKGGKGVVESYFPPEAKQAVIEEFQKGENCDPKKLKEQWTICIPG